MAALAAKYRSQGLTLYTVNVDSDRLLPRVEKFTADHPTLPCLADGTEAEGKGLLAKILGVRETPTHVLLDGKGAIALSASGPSDLPGLEEKIRSVLAGKSSSKGDP
jgi:hypothetical protein